MNRRSSSSLPFSKAILGFLQYKAAEDLSPNMPSLTEKVSLSFVCKTTSRVLNPYNPK